MDNVDLEGTWSEIYPNVIQDEAGLNLIVACVVGDGEAETVSLATSWQSNKFLDPITDDAVLPILHLNCRFDVQPARQMERRCT